MHNNTWPIEFHDFVTPAVFRQKQLHAIAVAA